jgi:hypothetical protein
MAAGCGIGVQRIGGGVKFQAVNYHKTSKIGKCLNQESLFATKSQKHEIEDLGFWSIRNLAW